MAKDVLDENVAKNLRNKKFVSSFERLNCLMFHATFAFDFRFVFHHFWSILSILRLFGIHYACMTFAMNYLQNSKSDFTNVTNF